MEILKTYKLYIDGQFPRTESGRTYTVVAPNGSNIANACLASRKDIRNAVVAARKAQGSWAARSGFNRSQIAYRIAEMLEDRKALFTDELLLSGLTPAQAQKEIQLCIDRCVYYAGWADKYQNLIGSVNPVSSAHFNFSVPEAMGVVGVVACQQTALIGLVSQILPLLIGGNTVVVIANSNQPLSAISFAEVLATSDVPGGVVNILTGQVVELLPTLAGHMDVNALSMALLDEQLLHSAQEAAVDNLKRYAVYTEDFSSQNAQGLTYISAFQEIKTTWHPIEQLSGGGSGY
ncbi:MAG: aldehyde dehydrogenase family protein [Flavobacteriales bacterium]